MPELSIVILNYNTKELLKNCLDSLKKVEGEVSFEVIVIDNGSTDGSIEMLRKFQFSISGFQLIENKKNLGFAAGNNRARKFCKGKYILFLNSDTEVYKNTLKKAVEYLKNHKNVGALTCKMLLPNGELDKDTRRSFITPWIGLTHLILRLDRLFPKSKLFAKYWYGYIPDTKEHEVDVIEGAFFLAPKKVLNKEGWFDETYFLDGENVDLCYRIKRSGWKIIYYPEVKILHRKGATKGKVSSETKKQVSLKEKLRFRMAGVDSMEIFYRRWLWNKHPLLVNILVILAIKYIKFVRFIRVILLG